METIFDHNLTAEEQYIFRHLQGETSQDRHWRALSRLYVLRNNPAKALEYANKIADPALRKENLQFILYGNDIKVA
jgi:hemerythrin superfamily protein